MPRTADASSVTRFRRLNATITPDPVKKSASYTPSMPSLLPSVRTSDVGRGMFPRQSVLSTSVVRPYVNPRHQGYIIGPNPPTDFVFILKNLSGTGDPGAGFSGFRIVPAVYIFSKTDANGRDASAFLSAMSSATAFTTTTETVGRGAFIWTIDGTPTDEGTHWIFPVVLPPGGEGTADVGDRLILTYSVS